MVLTLDFPRKREPDGYNLYVHLTDSKDKNIPKYKALFTTVFGEDGYRFDGKTTFSFHELKGIPLYTCLYIINKHVLNANRVDFNIFFNSFINRKTRFHAMNEDVYPRIPFCRGIDRGGIPDYYNDIFGLKIEPNEKIEVSPEEDEEEEEIIEEEEEVVEEEEIDKSSLPPPQPVYVEPISPSLIYTPPSIPLEEEDEYTSIDMPLYKSLLSSSSSEIDYNRIENIINTKKDIIIEHLDHLQPVEFDYNRMEGIISTQLQNYLKTNTNSQEIETLQKRINILQMENQELQRENEEVFERLQECERQFSLIKEKYKSLQQIKRKYKTMAMNGANINHIENIKDTANYSRKTFISPVPNEHIRQPYYNSIATTQR